MSKDYASFQLDHLQFPAPTRPAATIYAHPEDVSNDPKLPTAARKRAIFASWISDARAVENAPALLRLRLDSGAVVEVDAILLVLVSGR